MPSASPQPPDPPDRNRSDRISAISAVLGNESGVGSDDSNPDYGDGFMHVVIPSDSPEGPNFQFGTDTKEISEIKDKLEDEPYDSMVCNPYSKLARSSFIRVDRTDDTNMFINAGRVDSKVRKKLTIQIEGRAVKMEAIHV